MFQKLRISAAAKKAVLPTHHRDDDHDVSAAKSGDQETDTDSSTTKCDSTVGVNLVDPADDSVSSSSPSFTLLEELADALIGSVEVYGMANVRALLRASQNGGGNNNDSKASSSPIMSGDPELLRKAMELPVSRSEMMQLLQLNREALPQSKIPTDLYLSLLDSLGGALASSSSATSTETQSAPGTDANNAAANIINARWLSSIFKDIPMPALLSSTLQQGEEGTKVTSSASNTAHPRSVYVAVFDDENSNKELVYCISIDEERKLIKVVFRGSATISDWMANVDLRMATIPNPINDVNDGSTVSKKVPISRTVSIHKGVYSYLFRSSKSAKTCSKYETIIGHIKRLLVGRTGYKLHVSGHSLGGSLSTVFAFHAASDPELPKPVTCVSFGSPRCGNLDFARSYQHLERLGFLRSIRLVNDKDFVTMVPDRLAYAAVLTNSIYRHVGIELKLYPCAAKCVHARKNPRIHFPTGHASIAQHLADDASMAAWNVFTRPLNLVQACRHDYAVIHSLKEYADRLAGAAEFLQSRTVDDLANKYMVHCHH